MDNIGFNLKILAHNVNGWRNKRNNLFNCYKHEDPDVILISEHGIEDATAMKIFGYEVSQVNPTQGRFDGAAIAVQKYMKYRR